MPTINPASNTSRKTMMSAASTTIALLHCQGAARLLVEVVEELVTSGLEGAHIDEAVTVGGNDLLHAQRRTFELHRLHIQILDPEQDGAVCRCIHLTRLKLAVGIGHLDFRRILRDGG